MNPCTLPFRKALLASFLGACCCIAPAAQEAAAPPAQTVRIGVIGPFTGPSADFGIPMLHGVEMAVDEINAVGGYLGRKLELVVKDDGATPDKGLAQSKALVQEHVVATIGFCNTGVAMKSLPVFQENKLPLLVPCAAGSPVTAAYPAAESYIFRTSARDAIQAPFVVNDILRRGWNRVAIFADTTPYGESGLQDVRKALKSHGLDPVYVGRFPLAVKDVSEELKAAREAGANVIFTYTVGVENAVIARDRQALKWKVPIVGGWPLSFPFFINGAKEAAEGALMAQTFIAEPSNERRSTFLYSYFRKFQTSRIPVPMAAAQAYDTTYLLLQAIFGIREGQLSGPRIKQELESLHRVHYGVVATYDKPFSIDDKDAITPNMLVMGMVRNGQVTFAYPEDAKRNLVVQRKQSASAPRP